MRARAAVLLGEPWEVWVGPGPEPRTGRRLTAARWSLHTEGKTKAARLLDWLRRMERDPARCERARLDLAGMRLGCSCAPPCHAVALAEIAEGRSPTEIREEWERDGVLSETADLFEDAR